MTTVDASWAANDASERVIDESQYDGADDEAEAERQYLDPSRWWFASTACPLIAGTFGPMANAFSICALSSYWREILPPSGNSSSGTTIRDPPWLLAVNAVSLACALTANVALLFNMAGRARFEIAQPLTVGGFFTASVLLIGIIGAASKQDFIGSSTTNTLTQAYYYAIWAAAIYMILSLLMLLTVWGALAGKFEKRFNLTISQRTLMLQTISFMAYLLLGAAIFSAIEGWRYLDALFWADFTLLTIGLGEPLVPVTHAGRSLLIPYGIGGVVSVGLIINSIRTMLLETGKDKLRARTTEKMRSRVHSYADVLGPAQGTLDKTASFTERIGMPEKDRRRREFHAMRTLQDKADSRNKWYALAVSTFAACILWFIGALVFRQTEHAQGWSYFVSLYFSYTTLLTIGYGDYSPLSNSGRAFFVFWSLLAIPTLTVLISDMGDTVVKAVKDVTNWVGTLTLLPEAQGLKSAWRNGRKLFDQPLSRQLTDSPLSKEHQEHRQKMQWWRRHHHMPPEKHCDTGTMMRQRLSPEDTLHAQHAFSEHPRPNAAFYAWLLSREMAMVVADVRTDPTRKYSYNEWAYFLHLLGHDEGKPELHRRADPAAARRFHAQHPDGEVQLGRPFDTLGRARPWSWMGIRSPLMSALEESEWVLGHLIGRLARVLEGVEHDEDSWPVQFAMLDEPDSGPSADHEHDKEA